MSRPMIATTAALLFVVVYVLGAVALPVMFGRLHWALEAVYWAIAGVLWVLPIWWLMLWSVGKR